MSKAPLVLHAALIGLNVYTLTAAPRPSELVMVLLIVGLAGNVGGVYLWFLARMWLRKLERGEEPPYE